MPLIPYPSDDQIAPECREVLDAFENAYGRPSHIFKVLSHNPRFLITASESWENLVVKQGTLERWVKEAVVVITCSTWLVPSRGGYSCLAAENFIVGQHMSYFLHVP